MSEKIKALRDELDALCARIGRRVQIMEVCGTHTVSIFRTGIRALLPANLRLVSGPGCPVCVTAQRHIDAALQIAARDEVILATYGDMMRVPGRDGSLEKLRAGGARIRVINSAATALDLARQNPDRHIVFLAVGFETTAPATAATVLAADRDDLAIRVTATVESDARLGVVVERPGLQDDHRGLRLWIDVSLKF